MKRAAWITFVCVGFGSFACGGDVIIVRNGDAPPPSDTVIDTGSVDAAIDLAPDSQTCADLQAAAQATLNAVVAADQSCTVDSDCTYALGESLACCVFPIVNTASATSITDLTTELINQLAGEGCAIPPCLADCVGIELRCNAGTCETGGRPPDASCDVAPATASDSQSCADLQAAARSTLGATMALNQACASDADCVWAKVGCFAVGTIPFPSNAACESTVESLASQLCSQLATEGCEPVNPGLPSPILSIYCGNGQCTF